VVSGTVYTALFLALAALTRHAVVVGLLFVLVWEGLLGSVFTGVRWLSVGAWGRAVAREISPTVEDAAKIGIAYAVVAALVVIGGSLWLTGDRLRSFTLRGDE
jgi:ABC-2 type transport system permease protein